MSRNNGVKTRITTELHAPYHFVPQSSWVFKPQWAHLVNHDVPFEKAISGELKLKIKALSPICVGGKNEDSLVDWHQDDQGHPIIPGSSIKGMLRNVIEIATFGKMSFVDSDKRFSYRDFVNCDTYKQIISSTKVVAGYIKKDVNGDYQFSACHYAKITHQAINQHFGVTLNHDASYKVKREKLPNAKYENICFDLGKGSAKNPRNSVGKIDPAGASIKGGHLVLTGPRIGAASDKFKRFEYIFYGSNNNHYPSEMVTEHFDNFVAGQIDSHGNKSEQLQVLEANPHSTKGMPIFLAVEGNKIISMGIAQLPKVLYKNPISSLMSNNSSKQNYFDFAECLFGSIKEEHGSLSLKSRVHFSDAICRTPAEKQAREYAMSSPSATFCAGYLHQSMGQKVANYNDSGAKINGWKRYPPKLQEYEKKSVSENMKSTLMTLPAGVEFETSIMVHNLLPQELGCLLWAIQLGETKNSRYAHSIGHGKPLGLGIVNLDIVDCDLIDIDYQKSSPNQSALTGFIECMDEAYPSANNISWNDSPQIQHLLSFADYQQNTNRFELRYMELDDKGGVSYKDKSKGMLFEWKDKNKILEGTEQLNKNQDDIKSAFQGRLRELVSEKEFSNFIPEKPSPIEVLKGIEELKDFCAWYEHSEMNYKVSNIQILYSTLEYYLANKDEHNVLKELLIEQFTYDEIKKTMKVKHKDKAKYRKELYAQLIN